MNGNGNKKARMAFGIIMVILYFAISILFFCNFFMINTTISIVIGVLLVLCGIWRGYIYLSGKN